MEAPGEHAPLRCTRLARASPVAPAGSHKPVWLHSHTGIGGSEAQEPFPVLECNRGRCRLGVCSDSKTISRRGATRADRSNRGRQAARSVIPKPAALWVRGGCPGTVCPRASAGRASSATTPLLRPASARPPAETPAGGSRLTAAAPDTPESYPAPRAAG
jgi:hypothetical protein